MDDKKKLLVARRWLDMAKYEYERLVAVEGVVCGSVGLVARYEAIGGSSSGVSDNTARQAIAGLKISFAHKKKMLWLDVIFDVYEGLMKSEVNGIHKTPNRTIHDRIVARIMHYKIFDGMTMEKIGIKFQPLGKPMSKQHISRMYATAVSLIARLADERGLYDGLS